MVTLLSRPTFWGAFMDENKESFGDWLRRTRKGQGLGLRGLAEKAGITHPTLSLIENNKTGATRDMVRKLADALDVPRSEAIHIWLGDEGQEGGAITYVDDPDDVRTVHNLSKLSPVSKKIAQSLIDQLSEAEKAASIGGGIPRKILENGDEA